MRDFDQERSRTKEQRETSFTLGGVEFQVIEFVPPEHLDQFNPTQRPEGKTALNVYDEWIVSMLVEEDRPKWEQVRKPEDEGGASPPLSLHDIETLVFWLVELATGRPTARPSSSRSGPRAPTDGSEGTQRRVQAA